MLRLVLGMTVLVRLDTILLQTQPVSFWVDVRVAPPVMMED